MTDLNSTTDHHPGFIFEHLHHCTLQRTTPHHISSHDFDPVTPHLSAFQRFMHMQATSASRAVQVHACRLPLPRLLVSAPLFSSLHLHLHRPQQPPAVCHCIACQIMARHGRVPATRRDALQLGSAPHHHIAIPITSIVPHTLRLAALLTCDPATLRSSNPAVLQPCNRATLQPCNLPTLQPCNLATLQPCNPAILQPCNHAILQPCNPATLQSLQSQ